MVTNKLKSMMITENSYWQGMGGFLTGLQPILFLFKNLKNFKNLIEMKVIPNIIFKFASSNNLKLEATV